MLSEKEMEFLHLNFIWTLTWSLHSAGHAAFLHLQIEVLKFQDPGITCADTSLLQINLKNPWRFCLESVLHVEQHERESKIYCPKNNPQGKKINNMATCDSSIHRSDGRNFNEGMNIKFSLCQSQGGKVIQRASADVHHVVTCPFFCGVVNRSINATKALTSH